MSKRKVGLYLGSNSLGAVAIEGKSVVSLAKFDLPSLEEEAGIEELNEEVKWEVLINKALREIQSEDKEIHLSLLDKDFIFRTFPIPLMGKKEIESSLSYEIEKYIPFKIKELKWDYGVIRFPKEKKINVSFLGIRESSFTKIEELLSRLNLHIKYFEPSSLSLVRVLKSSKSFFKVKNFVVLDFGKFEGCLTYFYCDLPIFNRYFLVSGKENAIDWDKLIEPIRLSFQYLKRELNFFALEKVIIIGNFPEGNLIALLKEELQISVDMVIPGDFMRQAPSFIENLKALGAAGLEYYPYKFKPLLKKVEERGEEEKLLIKAPLKIGPLVLLIGLGVIVSLCLSLFMGNKISLKRSQLEKEGEEVVMPASEEGPLKDVEEAIKEKKKKADSLAKLVPLKGFSLFLEKLPFTLPEGLWLDNLSLRQGTNNYRGTLEGYVFLGNEYQERLKVDEFISHLRKDEAVKAIFSKIEMIFLKKTKIEEFEVISFSLALE